MFYLARAYRCQEDADRAGRRADRLALLVKAAVAFSLLFLVWALVAFFFGYSLVWPAVGFIVFAFLIGPPATLAFVYYHYRWQKKTRESVDNNQQAALHGERSWQGVTPY